MDKQWKEGLAQLRKRLLALRGDYRAGLADRRARKFNVVLRERFESADAQLRMLVPLYRAFVALAQQQKRMTRDVLPRSSTVYMTKFMAFQSALTTVVVYPAHGRLERYLGGGTAEMCIPDPNRDWELRSVTDIYEDVKKAQANRQAIDRQQRNTAEASRRAFLKSLSHEQSDLLKAAFEAARIVGVHAVAFHERDVTI